MNVLSPSTLQAKPNTLLEWLAWLERPRRNQMKLGLSRMQEAAKVLQCKTFACPVILVAGTNGKGTTVNALSAVYRQAGYCVGSYFSPHLERFNERIQINGTSISDNALSACFAKIREICKDDDLTYFEYTTLAALWYFSTKSLDLIILEVGLGGRLDATNIVEPTLSIITTVDYDHQAILGNSLEAIGREKAGIMRSGKPCILFSEMPKTVYEQATRLGVHLMQSGKDYRTVRSESGMVLYRDEKGDIALNTDYHADMQAGAVAATRMLQNRLPVDDKVLEAGLASMRLHGRQTFLRLDNGWQVCLDVAHNPQSVAYLAEKLVRLNWRPHIVFSCLADKDSSRMIATLRPYAKSWQIFPLSSPRAEMPDIIATEIQSQDSNANIGIYDSAKNALRNLFTEYAPDTLLICGSFHTVGEGLSVLKQDYRAQ